MERGFFRVVQRCKNNHWGDGCPSCCRLWNKDDDTYYYKCLRTKPPHKIIRKMISILENFPSWCPLDHKVVAK